MPVMYTLRQVADMLNVSLPTVERLVREKAIRSARIRGTLRVSEQAVADYIREAEGQTDDAEDRETGTGGA